MRFLVVFRENAAVTVQMPMPAVMDMVETTAGYLDDLKKKGKVVDAGYFAAEHGGCAIFDVDSLAELSALVESTPVRVFCDVECMPFLTTDEWRPFFAKRKGELLAQFEKMAAAAPKP